MERHTFLFIFILALAQLNYQWALKTSPHFASSCITPKRLLLEDTCPIEPRILPRTSKLRSQFVGYLH